MSLTESNMIELDSLAPDFILPNVVNGESFSLDHNLGDNGTLIIFICNHCPYVKHVNPELVKLYQDYSEKGINFIAISSNDVENYPQDSPEKMKETAEEEGYQFPYLYDESQDVAKSYDAACTPDFYLFDNDRKLYYRGRLDGSRPGNDIELTGEDLRNALDLLLDGKDAPSKQYPSAGCNIKWKES